MDNQGTRQSEMDAGHVGEGGGAPPPERETLHPGLRFGGGFTLIRRIGTGGMGEVWLAREESPRREVALKILRLPSDGTSAEDAERARRRFRREAAVMASCDHPSIIPVYGCGVDDATQLPWYSMKPCLLGADEVRHVCGDVLHCATPALSSRGVEPLPLSLADILRTGAPLPEKTVAMIGKALVSAVACAHALPEPVIHRDIKPTNILFTVEGGVVIADFGVAKRLGADGMAQTTSSDRRGLFVGTFAYAAPEQQDGTGTTSAVDYYSIAAVLYEALTGQRPGSLSKPSEFDPKHISDLWDALLSAMLASNPERRLADPVLIADALSKIETGRCWRMERRAKAFRLLKKVALGAVSAIAVLAGILSQRKDRAERHEAAEDSRPPEVVPSEVPVARSPTPPTAEERFRAFLLADRATFGGRHLSQEQRARRAGAVRTIPLPGDGAMDFVWCRNTELGRDIYDFTHYDDSVPIPDIEPSRLVLVTNFCYIGRTEVTVSQWNAVMGGGAEGDPAQPVLCTFRDAERFVRAMNALPAASNVVFRIPTEMEWEHGCRGISLCYFSHKNPEDVSWNAANSGGERHAVGQKKAVGYGLFDMHGNAPEWCADAFAPLGEGPLVNPFSAPATGDEDRVVRGGSCRDTVAEMLAEPRRGLSPDTGKAGFRLAMSDK